MEIGHGRRLTRRGGGTPGIRLGKPPITGHRGLPRLIPSDDSAHANRRDTNCQRAARLAPIGAQRQHIDSLAITSSAIESPGHPRREGISSSSTQATATN